MSIRLLQSIHPDYLATEDLVERVRAGLAVAIAGTPYLLVRLPEHLELSLTQLLFELGIEARVRPILLDAERNDAIQGQPYRLSYYYRRGARAAVGAENLVGEAGEGVQRTARRLVSARLAQMVVSGPDASPELLAGAERVVADLLSPVLARHMLHEIPAAVLAGEPIDFPPPLESPPQPRGWDLVRRYVKRIKNLR